MTRLPRLLVFSSIAMIMSAVTAPATGASRVTGLNLLNGTGETMTALFIRRTGTQNWQSLPAKPARAARAAIPFTDVDCAFDIRATLEDGRDAVWRDVNLCEVKLLTLNRNGSGATWVDYD
ncbi:MAG: hypothetical protein ABR588_04425 [Sphingomicrobium sp.]|nr:hypothetical protein [Sphingomonadales bacterium]